ncbi:hypothetical protein LPY66_13625 [Dehalobacter sp. DCM]|uniref:hypothetical protein n=1 Tax=Dehalobacter sp. DCM TaxID=2907827 RepID=UPI003081295A|nr:hypothetical protein LPY66_13625 [Dehalobacter sp. DCM]
MADKIKLPRNVVDDIRYIVYEKADAYDYLNKGRNENGNFISNLALDPEVGGVLKEYMNQQRIRTYVKDSILNRYAKDKIHTLLSGDIKTELIKQESKEVYLIERKTVKSSSIHLYRTEINTYIVVGEGTVLKWETALRRALEYIEVCPGKGIEPNKWKIYVCLAITGNSITKSDKEHIVNSLDYLNVGVIFLEKTV